MASTTTVPSVPTLSKVSLILSIIQAALTGVALIPGGQLASALGETFLTIIQNGLTVYQQETGQPLDLTKIPLETPAP